MCHKNNNENNIRNNNKHKRKWSTRQIENDKRKWLVRRDRIARSTNAKQRRNASNVWMCNGIFRSEDETRRRDRNRLKINLCRRVYVWIESSIVWARSETCSKPCSYNSSSSGSIWLMDMIDCSIESNDDAHYRDYVNRFIRLIDSWRDCAPPFRLRLHFFPSSMGRIVWRCAIIVQLEHWLSTFFGRSQSNSIEFKTARRRRFPTTRKTFSWNSMRSSERGIS